MQRLTKTKERESAGYWMLPKPDFKVKRWERIPRVSHQVPFGYEIDPEDDDWLKPISKELELLVLAKKHLKQYSYREVSAWLSTQSGRYISHMGLKKRIDVERKRKSLAAIKRNLAKRLEKTLRQYEILEKERLGYHTFDAEETDRTRSS
jgi:hypothetical protein|tara:strand:- start:625 stop:1074 length:450 start_codon:yes stop_codon:yes gene_type:complete